MADELQIPPIGSFGTFDKPLNMPLLEFPEFTPGQFDAPPPKVDPIDNLYRQITGQVKNLGTSKQWQGGALGELTFDGTARYMASILAERGITSIDQIGQETRPVYAPDYSKGSAEAFTAWYESKGRPPVSIGQEINYNGQRYHYNNISDGEGGSTPALFPILQTGETERVIVNKNTGQPLVPSSNTGHQYASSYAQPDGSYTWGGTYAGSGNTAFNLTFDEQGLPIFYTRGHSSSTFSPQDLGMIVAIGSLAFPGIGTAIGNFVASSVGLTVSAPVAAAIGSGILNTAITGDVKKGVLSAAGSYVGAQVAEGLGKAAADIFDSTAGQNFVKNLGAAGARAAVMGEDVGKAIQTAATGGMFNLVATQIPGFGDIKDKNLKALVSDSINTALNTEGDLSERLQRATLQGAISYGAGQVEVDGKKFADLTPGQKTLVTDLLSAELSGKPLDQALINSAIKVANSEITKAVKQSPGLYTEPVLADEFGVSGREDGQVFASDIFPEVTLAGPAQPSQDFDSIFSESLQQPVSGIEFPGGQTIQFDDGSSITFDDAGEITGVVDSEGVELPLFGPPAVQEFNAPDMGPRLPSGPTRELFGPEPGGITFSGGETITFDDGSSITFGPTGEIASLIDSEGVEIPIAGPTLPETAAPEEIPAEPEEITEPEEVIDPEEVERLAEESRVEEERLAEEARVTAEQERLAEEARRVEAERVANEERAQLFGFPNYATYQQFEGNYERYLDAQNELMAKGAEFPDYKTYMEYGGDLNAYEQDLLERDAIAAGFPDHFTQVQYGGSYDAYQADLLEQARLEEESIAREEGFPDLVTKQQYNGDLALFKNDQAVAEGWPDAATKEEYGTLERYAQHLKDEADLEARGQAWENEQTAISAGFPNYATYTQFDGDLDAYLESLESADTLEGGEGNDTFGDIGFDTSVGIDGDDTLVGDDTLDAGDGNDTFISEKGDDEFDDTGFDTSPGLDGDDTFVGDDTLISGDGNDTLAGDDTLVAGDGEDEFDDIGFDTSVGLDGDDTLIGAGEDEDEFDDIGFDTSPGLDGKDTLVGGVWGDETVNGGDGDDEVGPWEVHDTGKRPYSITDDDGNTLTVYPDGTYTLTPPIDEVYVTPLDDDDTLVGGAWGDETIVGGGDTPIVTDPANDPLGGDMPEEEEEEIDPATGLPRVKVQPPPKTVTPPKKPITPLPPGLTPEQLMQLFGQLGAPFGQLGAAGITGALQPYEMPYYFQIPEEQQFDITQAFSPTLYRLQKE